MRKAPLLSLHTRLSNICPGNTKKVVSENPRVCSSVKNGKITKVRDFEHQQDGM